MKIEFFEALFAFLKDGDSIGLKVLLTLHSQHRIKIPPRLLGEALSLNPKYSTEGAKLKLLAYIYFEMIAFDTKSDSIRKLLNGLHQILAPDWPCFIFLLTDEELSVCGAEQVFGLMMIQQQCGNHYWYDSTHNGEFFIEFQFRRNKIRYKKPIKERDAFFLGLKI